jgi:hypothetical protein
VTVADPGSSGDPSFGRRAFLTALGGAAGLALTRGADLGGLFGARPRELSYQQTLSAFAASLTEGQRRLIVLPADHPSRQVTNTLTFLERPHLGTLLSPTQQALASRLVETMLSERGRSDFAGTLAVEGKLAGSTLAIYGEPETGQAQATLIGGHVHVRGVEVGGAPLGGAVAYGHQIGNHRWRVAGNSFAYHGDAANELFAALRPAERSRAVVARTRHELTVQPQAAGGRFDGARVGGLGDGAREAAARVVDTVLGLYPDPARRRARDAIETNGGVDELRVAFYAEKGFYEDMQPWSALDPPERERRGDPYWQVWRLEGPGAVLHFQGHPHVHAYVHIVDDPARSHIGETLAESHALLEGEAMRDLLEAALQSATREIHAWYPPEVPGRFCPGPVTTGLAWSLDPYANEVVVAEVAGARAGGPVTERLETKSGSRLDPDRRYRIVTTDFAVREAFPDATLEHTGIKVRDALVAHLREGGLETA